MLKKKNENENEAKWMLRNSTAIYHNSQIVIRSQYLRYEAESLPSPRFQQKNCHVKLVKIIPRNSCLFCKILSKIPPWFWK